MKLAGNTESFRVVKTKYQCKELQIDLTTLSEWIIKRQLRLKLIQHWYISQRKTKLHPRFIHSLLNKLAQTLALTIQEMYLGFIAHHYLQTLAYCSRQELNKLLGIAKKETEISIKNLITSSCK